MHRQTCFSVAQFTWAASFMGGLLGHASAAELKVLFPQGRDAFQTNEVIDVSVVRSAPERLAAGDLTVTLCGVDGSRLGFVFAVAAADAAGGAARRTEHLHFNGWLLRPGKYTLEVSTDGSSAKADLEICSHVRQSAFRLVNWGRATGAGQLVQGEDSLGFNLMYMAYGKEENANYVRAGVDFMANCVMSGGHQMDLRSDCDWSDPLVSRGGTLRVARRAMIDRLRGNAAGVHFYDEPGLTWSKDPATGQMTPHAVPSQLRAYEAAFGRPPIRYTELDPARPEHVAQWEQWARWKLGFMDAAWKEAQFGVSRVSPKLLSVTQSQYGFSAFTDGYYFNVVRSLPVISGHGGYHDYNLNYFNPSYFLEVARARDFGKPTWYLPTWYGNTTPDQFRLEQYLSFQTGIQGMITPPDCEPAINPGPRQGLVESNQLMKKLGPIFHTMAVTKPPVAMLYSLSNCLRKQTRDRQANYLHDSQQGKDLPFTYLAGKLIQQQFLVVLDEDVIDGTLANEHQAVVVTSVEYLDPQVVSKLEEFATHGGLVLLVGDCRVTIRGAVAVGVQPALPDQKQVDELAAAGKWGEAGPYQTMGKYFAGTLPLAKALQAQLTKAGIRPVFASDLPTIAATRQAAGDVEYLFAVNATYDPDHASDRRNAIQAAAATLVLPDDGRPVYDAIVGGPVPQFKSQSEQRLVGHFRFGPGQLRVFARTARPLGGVRLATPVVTRQLTRHEQPLQVEIGVTVLDQQNRVLSGSVPLEVQVVDPLGATRYHLYCATKLGSFSAALPLAVNDPAGQWTVVVRELLTGAEDRAVFPFSAAPVRALAGATQRAVMFADDFDRCFEFARLAHDVTIVCGTSPCNEAAAQRVTDVLKPWGLRCTRLDLAAASKSRSLTEDEAKTWCGLDYASSGQVKPGDGNPPQIAGFAVQGPVILIGNPEDHPILRYLRDQKYLPYPPLPGEFPGTGRGLVAWQRDGVGRGQESVALIAYDEAGIQEAVGSFYEAVAGLAPLTRWEWPQSDTLTPAKAAVGLTPTAKIVWTVNLPDRVLSIQPTGGKLSVITHDGSVSTLDAAGQLTAAQDIDVNTLTAARKAAASPVVDAAIAKAHARSDRLLKLAATDGVRVALAYWGGTLRVADIHGKVITEQLLPQDITALTWSNNHLLAGLADGRVIALQP
ncbi:MAG: hypothetical protein NTY19_48870 [Planctomycetota bacterium]|nr:hypothetical protein [Planctomycetota bacterium]